LTNNVVVFFYILLLLGWCWAICRYFLPLFFLLEEGRISIFFQCEVFESFSPFAHFGGTKVCVAPQRAQRDAGASSSIMLLSVGVQVFTTCYWD
jgi:hypothetical protein